MPPDPPPHPKLKVFWTDLEKARIVKRAVDLQAEQPGLAGLQLLREALKILPKERQRELIALSQTPWFRRMVVDETKRREMELKVSGDLLPIAREHTQLIIENTRAVQELHRFQRDWQKQSMEALAGAMNLLKSLLTEIQVLNGTAREWSTVPMSRRNSEPRAKGGRD